MSTLKGVTTTKVTATKWTHWGELAGVEYTGAGNPESSKENAAQPVLRKGNKGEAVIILQTMLDRLGYGLGPCGADGDFGKCTEAAVKQFQRDRGLAADGICGPRTWREIDDKKEGDI